jgi:hypothetical protein
MRDGEGRSGRGDFAGALGMIDDKLAEIEESLLQGRLDDAERSITGLRHRLTAVIAMLELADRVSERS